MFSTETSSTHDLRIQLICKGLTWDDIKDLDVEELSNLDELVKVRYVTNPQETLTKTIEAIISKKQWHKLCDIHGSVEFLAQTEAGLSPVMPPHMELGILQKVAQKALAKQHDRSRAYTQKSANRATYVPRVMMERGPSKAGDFRWSYDTKLTSEGILARILSHLGQASNQRPDIFQILSTKDRDALDEAGEKKEIPQADIHKFEREGYMVSQEGLCLNMRNLALRGIIEATFPLAIDVGGYIHRLDAPLAPEGFLSDITVSFANPLAQTPVVDKEKRLNLLKLNFFNWAEQHGTDLQMANLGSEIRDLDWDQLVGCIGKHQGYDLKAAIKSVTDTSTSFISVDQECDGSGLYDPTCPQMENLVRVYGVQVFQFTLLRPDGLFAKGLLVPREGIGGIVLDPVQVKGAWKGKVTEGQTESGCFIGIMRSFERMGDYPGSFENLQFMNLQDESTKADLLSLCEEGIAKLLSGGIEGLIDEACGKDENLRILRKVVAQIRSYGIPLNPMGIPMMRDAVSDVLGKSLWKVFQGGGFTGKQKVCVLDASVPKGSVVVGGFKPGTQVGVWRFPNVLPSGLKLCTVVPPRPHQMVEGKLIQNTIWMNPNDLTYSMQGDDDGDIVGVSGDPRVLRLYGKKLFNGIYQIEPKGKKMTTQTFSREGLNYVCRDPRGPVGLTTIWQAKLLAAGDVWGGLAMAVVNQEAIDSAKRFIAWTDPEKAAQAGHWESRDGVFHLKDAAYDGEEVGFPEDYYKEWTRRRLLRKGCDTRQTKANHQPLAWRIQYDLKGELLKKRIHPLTVQLCSEKDNQWGGGNAVHWCHDQCVKLIQARVEEWRKLLGDETEILPADLLRQLLDLRGFTVGPKLPWDAYLPLRREAGLEAFKLRFRNAIETDSEDKHELLEQAGQELQQQMKLLSVEELVQVFECELTPTFAENGKQMNTPNFGWRVFFPGSRLMPLLGIQDELECGFLTPTMLEKLAGECLAQENPWEYLTTRVAKNTTHGDTHRDEQGNRLELTKCKTCMDGVQTYVVRAWRKEKKAGSTETMKKMVSKLNETTAFYK